jgi:predicted secreted hydrolase
MKSRLLTFVVLFFAVLSPAADYKLALPGYHYAFPRDHFDHPDYQTEWWYYTGNLRAADGHRFGFELTFFRQAIARDADQSQWHIHDLYMAHLALSDLSGQRFYHDERLNRAGPGIAGVDQATGTVWNGNWQVQLTEARQTLRGLSENFEIRLDLIPAKAPVIHGRDGISQKAPGAGHASHYISFSRLLTSGSIEFNGTRYKVEGTSWMDHEFFSESVDTNERGWDWLSLQLDDNTEVMLYRLRHKDGSVDPYSSGSYIDAKGHCLFLASTDFTLTPTGKTWTSDRTKGTYQIQWHIAIPKLGMDLDITTPLAGQELPGGIGPSYWEGAIDIAGHGGSGSLRGVGYLEMTGYAAAQHN